jgi:hypothetical protein
MRQPGLLGSAHKGIGIVGHIGLAPEEELEPVENVSMAN